MKSLSISIWEGAASIKIIAQSLKIGIVVNKHKIAKIKVHIGSAICQSGLKKIIIAAITTPIL